MTLVALKQDSNGVKKLCVYILRYVLCTSLFSLPGIWDSGKNVIVLRKLILGIRVLTRVSF